MFIRAYKNITKGELQFIRTDFDGPQRNAKTGELINNCDVCKSYFSDLEFLNWKTGKSRYDENGRMI